MHTLAACIDHTLLKPEATAEQVCTLCRQAMTYGFASVCVNGCYVPLAHDLLRGSGVKTCCVIGFPLGAMSTQAKVAETRLAVAAGAEEIDMVMHIGAAKQGDWQTAQTDIQAVVQAARPALVKVILETCLLTEEEIVQACLCAQKAGAAFVKTSTGFGVTGAKAADVVLMRRTVGDTMKIKASGGIRTYEQAKRMLDAGADRLGVSNSVAIMQQAGQSI